MYKFAFIMDPLEGVLVDKDTTFVFMLEAQRRGHQIYFLGLRDLYSVGRQVQMHGLSLLPPEAGPAAPRAGRPPGTRTGNATRTRGGSTCR